MATHEESGIRTRVSVPVYPKDILSEFSLITAPPDVKGAWLWCLFIMWHEDTDRVSGTYDEMGRLWGCSSTDAEGLVGEINARNIGDVTLCPKNVTHDVTLMSRRLNRRKKAQEQARKRKQKQRERECHADVTPSVTVKKTLPSFSSSSSSSSTTKNRKKKEPLLPFDSTAFRDAWDGWVQHRKEIRKKLTPLSVSRSFNELKEMGEERAIAATNLSIASGWTGIFEGKDKGGSTSVRSTLINTYHSPDGGKDLIEQAGF